MARDEVPRPTLGTFADPELDDRFWRDGYATFPLLGPGDAEAIEARWLADRPTMAEPFETSALHPPSDPTSLAMHEDLHRRFQPRVDELFVDHQVRHGYLMDKAPVGHDVDHGAVPVHQDWTFVDERQTRGVVIWCPLRPLQGSDGLLQVVPGSHRLTAAPRGAGPIPWSLTDEADELADRLLAVQLPAGHAVAYDGALVHASAPNRGDRRRPVIGLGVTHREARHVTFHLVDGDRIEGFEVAPDHFLHADLLRPPEVYLRRVTAPTG